MLRLDAIEHNSLKCYIFDIHLCFHSDVCDLIYALFLDDLIISSLV